MDVVTAAVVYNHRETPSVQRLGLAFDARSRGPRAARFAMLALPDRRLHLLPRPFSISDLVPAADGGVVTEFLFKPIGRVTRLLAALRPGDPVRVGGLCGNGFPDPDPARRPVLLAGGIGNAPFAFQVRELVQGRFRGRERDIVLFLAGRTKDDVYIQDVVRAAGITIVEVTDDGSRGEQGRITEALARRLPGLGPIEGFACGPEPMLHAVQRMALEHGFPCHLSVEERMACGYGVCNACVVEERRDGVPRGQGGFLRACVQGPVFEAKEIHA